MIQLIDEAEVRRGLRAFIAPGTWFEIRILRALNLQGRSAGTVSGCFDDIDQAVAALAVTASTLSAWDGCYVTPNPLKPGALSAQQGRFIHGAMKTAGDADMLERRWLLLDIDAERPKVPDGTTAPDGTPKLAKASATDAEKGASLDVRDRVVAAMTTLGFPAPVLCDSGNGGHAMWLSPGVDDATLRRLLVELDRRFSTAEAKIDQRVFNLARIWKLPGTMACKGPNLPDRPWRMARIQSAPDVLGSVSASLCQLMVPPAPPVPTLPLAPRSETAAQKFDEARAKYLRERSREYPIRNGTCPACGHNDCFRVHGNNPERWMCRGGHDGTDCGVKGANGYSGDVLDLDSYAAGRTPKEHLLAENYLEAYVDRLADPSLLEVAEGVELARQDWERHRAAQAQERKAKGPAGEGKARETARMNGSHEIRFATASDTELSGALVDDTKTDDGEGGKVAMVWDEGQFWRYEGGVWKSLDDKSLERHVHGFDGVYCFDPDDEDSKKRPWKLKMTHGRVVGVVASTRAMLHKDKWFDRAPTGVMFSDVFVTVDDSGQIRGEFVSPEHRQRHRLEQGQTPLAFAPGALPSKYIDLIERGIGPCVDLAEKVQLWREWAGMALLGRQTFRRAMFLLGDSGSGKSVTAKVLLGLLPDVAKTSMTMANIDPVGFGKAEYYLADLSTARINADLDVRSSMFVAGENFMKLVSQDPIAARQPGGKTFTFKPRTAMLMAGETLPTPDNKNPGFFNRFIILRFAGGEVAAGQTVFEYERDILEAERAQIASWLIEGAAMAIQRGRFEIPATVNHERQAWAQAVDSVHLWLVECTADSSATDQNDWAKAGLLFSHYREWCGKNGYQPVAINKFGERLRKALPAERWFEHPRDHRTRYGVRTLSQSEMEALR